MSKVLKICIIVIPVLFFFLKDYTFAQTYSDIVEVSLRLSVCGDKVVEGQEDCERGEKIERTCEDFGYEKGVLHCDNSCSFDFHSCHPFPEPPEEEIPNIDEEEEDPGKAKKEKEEKQQEKTKVEEVFRYIPLLLRTFDFNRDSVINFTEFTEILVNWVENWRVFRQTEEEKKGEVKGSCDVNFDGECNVIDFSIILYYVDND